MGLETIYVARHGFRMTWSVDPYTVQYHAHITPPTGIPADPALSSYGEGQAEQLGVKLASLDPPIDQICSSPYYRCLQTLKPGVLRLQKEKGYKSGVRLERGFEEWYGSSGDVAQPTPCEFERLSKDFYPELDLRWDPEPDVRPGTCGESIEELHSRIAYALHRIVERADRKGWKSILICTHAAVMIAIGRCLTGTMPHDVETDDFQCFTASLSQFKRRTTSQSPPSSVEMWDDKRPDEVPRFLWKDGRGVQSGWDCVVNADCSFLRGGEERGWNFHGDESFIRDPNAFNDRINEKKIGQDTTALNENRAVCVAAAKADDEDALEEKGSSKL